MKIILNEIQDDLLTIKTVIEKYYSIVPLSTFNEINLSDNYSIQIAIVFVPKKESTITPEIYTASARFKIGQSDTIGRPLFMISSQSYPSDEIMPLLSLNRYHQVMGLLLEIHCDVYC